MQNHCLDVMMTATMVSDLIAENPAWGVDERRKSRRVPLHWTLFLACNGSGHPVRTRSRNISSDGFYCLVDRSVRPGDKFSCDILIPTHASLDPDEVVYLRCHAQAVRVESLGDGTGFGLACQIEDYCLLPSGAALGGASYRPSRKT
jgi:hypothetical protein